MEVSMRLVSISCSFLVVFVFQSLVCDAARAKDRVELSRLTLRTTDGQIVESPDSRFTVLCFLGTECPLANLYAGRLQKLADQFEDDGVAFVGVNSNAQDSPAEIDAYIRKHQIRFVMLKDVDQSIANSAKS